MGNRSKSMGSEWSARNPTGRQRFNGEAAKTNSKRRVGISVEKGGVMKRENVKNHPNGGRDEGQFRKGKQKDKAFAFLQTGTETKDTLSWQA